MAVHFTIILCEPKLVLVRAWGCLTCQLEFNTWSLPLTPPPHSTHHPPTTPLTNRNRGKGFSNQRLIILFISFRFVSFHFVSFRFISFHLISSHLISFHFIEQTQRDQQWSCDRNPCQNGGTCKQGIARCVCSLGYVGDYCEGMWALKCVYQVWVFYIFIIFGTLW